MEKTNINKPSTFFYSFEFGLILWVSLFTLNLHVSWHDPIRFSNAKECLGINCRFFCFVATAATLLADAYSLRAIIGEKNYKNKNIIIGGLVIIFLFFIWHSYKNTPQYTRYEPNKYSCGEDEEIEKEIKRVRTKNEEKESGLTEVVTSVVNQMNEWAGNEIELSSMNRDLDVMKEEKIWPREKRLTMWVLVFLLDVLLVFRDLRLGRFAYSKLLSEKPGMQKIILESVIRFIGIIGPVIDYMNIKLNQDFKACKYGLDEEWDK